MTCKYCGCDDEHACVGGCYWVASEVCSNPKCVAQMQDEKDAVKYVCRACRSIFNAVNPLRCPGSNCKSADIVTKEMTR